MEIRKIRELVRIIEESTLTELNIKEGDFEVRLSKGTTVAAVNVPAIAPVLPMQPAETVEPEEEEEESELITAPIVGTFYAAPAPDAAPYVKVGDRVKKGQTLCILEAMKMMNEIDADFDCEIEAILVSNEQKVEYGQPLFRVRKG